MTSLAEFRKEYTKNSLNESDVCADPIMQFNEWMNDAIRAELSEPNAMTLATCTPEGKSSARIVLLKEVSEGGFVFFTNYLSRKGRELLANPFASLVFDWHEIERQVRVEGSVERVSPEQSDAYFHSRPKNSRLGAWTSPQSAILKNREELEALQTSVEKKFENAPIPRPQHWGGFLIRPSVIEFWQGRPNRLHDRIVYYKTEEGWTMHRLAP